MISVAIEPARQPEVLTFLRLGEEFALGLYPPEGCFLLDVSELEAPGIEVFVARDAAAAEPVEAPVAEAPPELVEGPVETPAESPAGGPAPVEAPALGMVALVDRGDGTGEIKRMFVLESARGRGVARSLLAHLEERAAQRSIRLLQLETGTEHTAALTLYPSLGYRPIPRFGPYVESEFSVCMEKALQFGNATLRAPHCS